MKNSWILIFALFFLACTGNETAEVKDPELTIQISAPKNSFGTKDKEYKIRIFHEINGSPENKEFVEQMQYHMDSCFYYLDGEAKQYPTTVIPVANGIKNCFEYLVVFNQPENKKVDLFYTAKYINNKTYQLSLK